jgi:hypothetical protein
MVSAAWFMRDELNLGEWIRDHDRIVTDFQTGLGALLTTGQYRRLLRQAPGEIVGLLVPADARRAYPDHA